MFLSWVHFDAYPLRERASRAVRFLAHALAAAGACRHEFPTDAP